VCLIDPNETSSFTYNLNRCGRTDKGVSALSNVLSLNIRKLKDEDYLVRMNRCLPTDIRMLAWTEVDDSFDARFSCVYREYNYFFFQQQMNVSLIAQSAKKLLGLHDFRNFGKKDENVFRPDDEEQNFMRRIYVFRTQLVTRNKTNPGLNIYKCVISGSAFLWH
jgi:tRNA pseudouridine38/39 synthase